MTVLLTDASYKNSLAILRSLGSKNIEVFSAGAVKRSVSFYSKYCKKALLYSNPIKFPQKFKKEIEFFVKKNPIDVLMPVGLAPYTLVSQEKEKLMKYTRVPVADYENFERAHDKASANEIAKKLNIPVPFTVVPKNLTELKKALKEFSYPIIIKARKGTATNQIAILKNKEQVITKWKAFTELGKQKSFGIIDYSYPMLQEYLPGEIIDVVFLFNKGKPIELMVQKRLLTRYDSGGSGSLNMTIVEPNLIKQSIKLMSALDWHGVGMVEFKRDRNGVPKLLEINTKFWGTTETAIAAEVDFPYLLYKLAMGEELKPNHKYLFPKKFGWPFPMGIECILDSKKPLIYVKEYLKLLTQKNSIDIQLTKDPKPFAQQLYVSLRILASRFLRTSKIRKDSDHSEG